MPPELIVALVVILAVVVFAVSWAIDAGRRDRQTVPAGRDLGPAPGAVAPTLVAVPSEPVPAAWGGTAVAPAPAPVAEPPAQGAADPPRAARASQSPMAAALESTALIDASTVDGPPVRFSDVAGLDHAIAELREIKDYLADPERFRRVGAELPRGILLWGEPGNGKTLLGRALAGEAGVPFYCISAAGFVEQYVGMGAARIRHVFDEVKAGPLPAILFIDELDAIGSKRTGGPSGDREFDHTLNQLLVELDGFATAPGLLILGATNRIELLDPALVRPGRFDRRLHIGRPDLEGRAAILRLHASDRPFSDDVDWDAVARHTAGLAAAELASMVNDACLLAARRNQVTVERDEVEEAMSRVATGTRSSRLISQSERRLISCHEAGHALLALLLEEVEVPARVSIVSRGHAESRSAWSLPGDRETLTRPELTNQLVVLLGGRAAELNESGEPSTRAEDDLDDAAKLARRMVERWAMTGRFELAGRDQDPVTRSRTETRSEPEVAGLLARAEQVARSTLAANVERLRAVSLALCERETLSIAEVATIAGLPAVRHHRVVEPTLAAVGPHDPARSAGAA